MEEDEWWGWESCWAAAHTSLWESSSSSPGLCLGLAFSSEKLLWATKPNQPTETPNNNNNNNFLQKYHWTFLVKSFSVPYHEAINTFPQTTLPSTNIQGCVLGTVPAGFLSGFHSPHPGSFQPKQEQVQPHPKARGHGQMAKMSGRLYCGGRKRKHPPRIHEERAGKNLARTLVQCQAPSGISLIPTTAGHWATCVGLKHWFRFFFYFPPQENKPNIFTTKITGSAIIGKLLQIEQNWHFNYLWKVGSEFKFSVTSSCAFSFILVFKHLNQRIAVGKCSPCPSLLG